MQCPRCQGLLVVRDVVTRQADERELHCVMCSRSYARRVIDPVYRPMPDGHGRVRPQSARIASDQGQSRKPGTEPRGAFPFVSGH